MLPREVSAVSPRVELIGAEGKVRWILELAVPVKTLKLPVLSSDHFVAVRVFLEVIGLQGNLA
jgi:hypothetical protein